MKKIVLIVFGVIASFLVLTSCKGFKPLSTGKNTQTGVSWKIIVIEVDTNLYNTYFVNYKNGQTQTLQYEYRYNIYRVIDSVKVDHVDTLQYKVLWKELN
jgi:hypothetical protein